MFGHRLLFKLCIAIVVAVFCFSPTSADALLIQNLTFTVAPTIGPHGYTAVANVSFNFLRQALWAADWGTIKFHVELWESDPGADELIVSCPSSDLSPLLHDINASDRKRIGILQVFISKYF